MFYNENVLNPPLALLCPPHSHFGGDMENNVILSLNKVLAENVFAVLQFNYRGVCCSKSKENNIVEIHEYWENILNNDDCSDAIVDVISAINLLESTVGITKIFIVGYSFGAMVAMMEYEYNCIRVNLDTF